MYYDKQTWATTPIRLAHSYNISMEKVKKKVPRITQKQTRKALDAFSIANNCYTAQKHRN